MNTEQAQIDDRRVLAMVRKMFSGHGVRLEPRDLWLVGDNGYAFSASTIVHEVQENHAIVRLDIDVSLPGGRLITECFVGVGDGIDEALENALVNFTLNSLHVFLTAFCGVPPDDQVTIEQWDIEGATWRVVIGNFVNRNSTDAASVEIPEGLFENIQDKITSIALRHDIHWFRFYYGQVDGEADPEFLVDNEHLPQAEIVLSSLDWVRHPGFYSVRNFGILLRDPPVRPEHLDQSQALDTGLEIVIRSWSEGDISDTDLYRRLTNAGIDGETAERLITFVSLGFSSVLLSGAKLPLTYSVVDENGKLGAEQSLDEEPAFRFARERARQSSHDLVAVIASRCAMVNAAMQVVDGLEELSADRIKDWEFAPPAVFIPRFSPHPASAKKPFWKLW